MVEGPKASHLSAAGHQPHEAVGRTLSQQVRLAQESDCSPLDATLRGLAARIPPAVGLIASICLLWWICARPCQGQSKFPQLWQLNFPHPG